MSTTPRDPSEYSPTTHAGQQAKHRGIDWERVADAIEHGEVRDTHKSGNVLFVEDAPDSVGVVADTETCEILTVAWYE